MISHTQRIGFNAEKIACQFLKNHGLSLITKNFRSYCGEIDLIMREANEIVFVEVRYRKNNYFGSGADTISFTKQQRLIRTAEFYLTKYKHDNTPCRFDVIDIAKNNDITWIKNAFDVEY